MGAADSRDVSTPIPPHHFPHRSPTGKSQLRQQFAAQQRCYISHLNPLRSFDPSVYENATNVSVVYARNPLCDAAALCDIALVQALLRDAITDVNAMSEEGETALHVATRRGHTTLMEMLLDAGARVNGTDRNGFTPLHHAIQCDLRQAKVLLDGFYPPNSMQASASSTYIASSNEALVALLLQRGALPSRRSLDGTSCFLFALRRRMVAETVLFMKHDDTAKLITLDAPPSATGETPLHLLAALNVVNLLDASLKSRFFTPSRLKPSTQPGIVAAIAEYRTRWSDTYQLPLLVDSLVSASTAPVSIGASIPLAAEDISVATLNPETAEEAMSLARNCRVGRWEGRLRNGLGLDDDVSSMTRAPGTLSAIFPLPIAQRQPIDLASMVASDRFRASGTIPSPHANESELECHLWAPARVSDTERPYVGVIQKMMRLLILQELGSGLQALRKANGNRSPSSRSPASRSPVNQSPSVSPTSSGHPLYESIEHEVPQKPKPSAKAFLSFELFCDLLDRLESPSERSAADRDDARGSGAQSPTSGDDDDRSVPLYRRDESIEAMSYFASPPSAATPVPSVPTQQAPTAGATRPMGLKSRMQLLLGEGATPSLPVLTALGSAPRTMSDPAAFQDLRVLLPMARTTAINPLDAVMTVANSVPPLLYTPLAMCNNTGTLATPLSEKRCILMLMCLRAQLLAEESFGFLLHDC